MKESSIIRLVNLVAIILTVNAATTVSIAQELTQNVNAAHGFQHFALIHFDVKHYWLPIPRSEILAGNGQLQQNAGY
jgi:hypothetical protein